MQRGLEQGPKEVAINMLNKGIAIAIIADVTGLSIEQVQVLQSTTTENPDS
ncbi:hypothetical protein [Brunnivagina elsteri]|uniref:hypothetical protein n=1 Tax=Brunnivagina elsteri TaxID=1247191 RepID=UPI001303F7F6|nr:hypothetical protein [Calothrix elsteri]